MTLTLPLRKIHLRANNAKLLAILRVSASIVLLALVMFALARWVWLLLSAPTPTPLATAHISAPSAPMTPPQAPNSARLWGDAPPAVVAPQAVQDTRLPLTLRGTLSGEHLAMIEASGSGTKVYHTGDTLPGGAKLVAVFADHVLLERAGVTERLSLPQNALRLANSAPQDGLNTSASSVDKASLGRLLQQSPAELGKEFRLTPVVQDGKLRGYRLRALRNPELFKAAGLDAEDVLLSVNGIQLTQANDLPKFIKDLRSATVIDAVVLRNGVELPLRLDLNAP